MRVPDHGSARTGLGGRIRLSTGSWIPASHGLLLLFLVVFWSLYVLRQPSVLGFAHQRDFVNLYIGARALATGSGRGLYDLATQHRITDAAVAPYRQTILLPFNSPAYVAVLLRPLGLVSLGPAFLIWTLLNLVATIWLTVRLARYASAQRRERLGVLLAILSTLPLQLTLLHGQAGLLIAVGVMEAWFSLARGNDWRAGLWLGLGLLKPHLILFPVLVLLLWRRWRSFAAFVVVAASLMLVSIVELGNWIPSYLRFLVECNKLGAAVSIYPTAMENWRAVLVSFGARDGVLGPALLGLACAAIVAWVCLKFYPGSENTLADERIVPAQVAWGIAIVLGLVSAPHLYLHDWVVGIPAGVFFWSFLAESKVHLVASVSSARSLELLLGAGPPVFFAAEFFGTSGPLPLVPFYAAAISTTAIACLRLGGTR